MQYSVASHYVAMIIDFAESLCIDRGSLLAITGTTEKDLEDPHFRISADRYNELFAVISETPGVTNFGLHSGQIIKPNNYGILGLVLLNCSVFGEAMVCANRYNNLVGHVGYTDHSIEGGKIELSWHPNIEGVHPELVEQHVAALVAYSRWITGREESPLTVYFTHEAPSVLTEHQAFYRCPLEYEADRNAVVLPTKMADYPIPQPNTQIKELLESQAQKLLKDLNVQSEWIESVKQHLAKVLPEHVPSIEEVALHFGLHERKLQRLLQQEKLTFRELLNQTRHELALHYMKDTSISLPEIAFLLGFSEQSAFQRAFKRWTGTPPGRFRALQTTA